METAWNRAIIGATNFQNRQGTASQPWLKSRHVKFAVFTVALAIIMACIAILIPRTAHATNNEEMVTDSHQDPMVVTGLQLNRFVGTWYEIATIPQIFERNCVATRATYTALPNGEVDVFNQCHDKTFDGRERNIHGKAWAPDAAVLAKLRVQFFWPLSAPYWVIALDENNQWAITGSPDHKNLWFLSRARSMEPATYQILSKLATDQGFDTSSLRLTPQPSDSSSTQSRTAN